MPRNGFRRIERSGSREPDGQTSLRPRRPFVVMTESLDYDTIENFIYRKERYSETTTVLRRTAFTRWWVSFWIGIFSALAAFIIDYVAALTARQKFKAVLTVMENCDDCVWLPFLVYVSINLTLVGVAAAAVFIEPAAGGSGIPEVKCYLNGLKIPHIVRFKTLVCKIVGVIGSVAASLAVGPEGPMIHSGAIIGAGISQGKTSTFNVDTDSLKRLRNDAEKRDFVASGAAAGIAAGFGAPVGGVLFSLEEGNSFWNIGLVWRTFFSTIVSAFTFRFLMSGVTPGITWGHFAEALYQFPFVSGQMPGYSVTQLLVFILMGVTGGLFGALFNLTNTFISKLRIRYLKTPFIRFLEALLVGLVSTVSIFLFCYLTVTFNNCRPIHTASSSEPLVRFFCPEGTYNGMATILFNTQQDAIELLFNTSEFSRITLILFFLLYFVLAVYTLGTAVPAGLFVPLILAGCAYGRFIGDTFSTIFPWLDIYPGTIALIGAASLLGGVMRMTISLTVILIESTNDITYGFPIMISVLVAKFVGDFFSEGLYEILIELKHRPLLAYEPPAFMRKYRARDIMAHPVRSFRQVESVRTVFRTLGATEHNGFPIVDQAGVFVGLILRHQLITILNARDFKHSPQAKPQEALLSQHDFQADYPRYPGVESVRLSEDLLDLYIDMTPYMNPCPFVIQLQSPLTRVFRLFRTMGLRHLVVVNHNNRVMGIISRKDLSTNLEEKLFKSTVEH